MEHTNEATTRQIERFVKKIEQKFSVFQDSPKMTDIHIKVSPESGEMLAFDDDDNEITRCVVEQWIASKDENFYDTVQKALSHELQRMKTTAEGIAILKPFSFVLEDDESEHVSELYLVDDDISILSGDLMQGLDEDLNNFMKQIFD